MKLKLALAAAALAVIAAQIHYTVSRNDAAKETAPAVAETAEAPAAPAPAAIPAEASAPPPPALTAVPPPAPEAVRGIQIFGADGADGAEPALVLSAATDGWVISSMDAAPADPDKVARFLDGLLRAHRQPLPLNAGAGTIGLGPGEGVTVRLVLESGDAYPVRIGLRPEGDYRATFVAFGDEPPVVLESDLRGPLGLWKNEPAPLPPPPAGWVLTRPLRFTPADVVRIAAAYSDHETAFTRGPGGGWTPAGYAPGGGHDNRAVDAWLADLAGFTVTGLAPAPGGAAPQPAASVTLDMADGTSRKVDVFPSPDGAGMRAVLNAYPGVNFTLPDWRYGKYFLRTADLFPKAVPGFAVADIRLIDLRHGGESAKIARQDGEWRLVGLPYALRPERAARLARLASALAPEDHANPARMPPRAAAGGGPVLEIVLADGTMHQYRLGGRHPVFAWRYVTVDNAGVLSVSEAATAELFPSFGAVLDLGGVFAGLDAAGLTRVELIRADDGARLLSLARDGSVWTAGNERGSVTLSEAETAELAAALPGWRVADFFEANAAAGGADGMLRLRLTDDSGAERGITLLTPQGRDIPYLADGERAFLLRRTDFFGWLGAVRGVSRRIDAAAEENTAAQPEEDAPSAAGERSQPPAGENTRPPVQESPAPAPPASAPSER